MLKFVLVAIYYTIDVYDGVSTITRTAAYYAVTRRQHYFLILHPVSIKNVSLLFLISTAKLRLFYFTR